MLLISKRTLKLFVPISFIVGIMFLAYYSRDLLKYGNRDKWPIYEIVEVIQWIIFGVGFVLIAFMIELYLTNLLQEIKIQALEKEFKRIEKG